MSDGNRLTVTGSVLDKAADISDETLALDVQRGRQAALAQLVERHHSPLSGYLYRMTNGDQQLAEDLVQETFLRVVRGIGQYRYPRPFKPWLYAIATNLTRDHYKAAGTRLTTVLDEDLFSESSPEEATVTQDETEQVIATLASMPDFQREVIVLRFYQGLSIADIAETLAIPVGTVKSRLSLGLKRLRERLLDSGQIELEQKEELR